MASSSSCILQLLLLLLFLFSSSFCNARIIFPIRLDAYNNYFSMQMNLGSPLEDYYLDIDLGGNVTWLPCASLEASPSSRRRISRISSKCSRVSQPPPCVSCNRTTPCSIPLSNPVTGSNYNGELFSDVMSFLTIPESDDYNLIRDPNHRRFTFGCATGASRYGSGVAGLGRSSALSLVFQFSAAFRFSRIFALYLATPIYEDDGETYTGAIYFGGGPYRLYFDNVAHPTSSPKEMIYAGSAYARLLINPKSREDYYIDLRSINIVGDYANHTYAYVNEVPIDKRLLSINKITGVGGTKISVAIPYTILQTSVYEAVTEAYINKAKALNISTVDPIAPFTACFRVEDVENLPQTSFVLSSKKFGNRNWVISYFHAFRYFSKEEDYVSSDVKCLAFVDGGLKPMASIVIGVHQLKDKIIEFDIPRSQVVMFD